MYRLRVTSEQQTLRPVATQRILTVIQHDGDIPLDRLAGWWDGLVQIRVVRADLGEPVPSSAAEVGDGLVVLGGECSAYDDEACPWLPATRALLSSAAQAGVPTLAICLGAQLLAAAAGGQVQVAAPPGVEAGITVLHWRPEAKADPVLGAIVAEFPTGAVVPALHGDAVVDLPRGAVWLASSDMYPFQAFRWGSAWGVQFHPEASPATVGRWARQTPGVDAQQVEADLEAKDAPVQVIGRALAEAFVAVVDARAAGGAEDEVGSAQSVTRSSASTIV
jgi:GMP synthase (glutamine-hydrolysing)